MELFVELMASVGDRRTQARAREATRWRWLTALVPLAGSSSRLPSVALNGGSWWLSRVETPSVLWLSWLSRWCE